jgi:hypothetical protein
MYLVYLNQISKTSGTFLGMKIPGAGSKASHATLNDFVFLVCWRNHAFRENQSSLLRWLRLKMAAAKST